MYRSYIKTYPFQITFLNKDERNKNIFIIHNYCI
jgi:hypothetical protein